MSQPWSEFFDHRCLRRVLHERATVMSAPRWRRLLRMYRADPRTDVHDEFAFHLEERTEALVAKGMDKTTAREMALLQFGDFARATETCTTIGTRRARRTAWKESLLSVVQDVVYAINAMRRAPGFALVAVATIALGIGANTVVFSLLNALLLQPLDATNPKELVRIYTSEGGRRTLVDRDRFGASSYADYADLRASGALSGLAAFMPLAVSLKQNQTRSRFEARLVSDNYFAVLGRPLFQGGWHSDAANSGIPEVVVSYNFWKQTLNSDLAALGRSLVLNEHVVTVVGITAPKFKGIELSTVDFYFSFRSAPLMIGRFDVLSERGERSLRIIGRLASGYSAESAQQSLGAIMRGLGEEFPASNAKRTVTVRRATSIIPLELSGSALVPTAGLVFGATLVMLGLTGVNVAAVLLARTVRRRRELAVRLSLGASRFRIVRQLLTESVTLALAAGVVVLALLSLLPVIVGQFDIPASVHPTIDFRVLGYAVTMALGFGALFGMAPAFSGIRTDVVDSLRSGHDGAQPSKARAHRVLVCAQLALSMLLLLVGGALLGSLDRQQRVNPGFSSAGLVVADFEDPGGMFDATRQRVFARMAFERLSNIPGVIAVSVGSMAPLTGDGMRSTIHIPGYVPQPDENMEIQMMRAGPDFFKALGIPMQRGTEVTWNTVDTVTRVVVNRAMARKFWGDRNPVGTFVQLGGSGGRNAEVIGVATDAHFIALGEVPQPMYVVQSSAAGGSTLLVRTSGDASTLMLAVRGIMSRNEIPLTMVQLRPMQEILRSSLAVTRAVSDVLLAIGVLAVVLAAVGLYGVVSYVMAGRTREFGIRLALGATQTSIRSVVLAYGMKLMVIGGAIGLLLGAVTIRLISGLIFGSNVPLPIVAGVVTVLTGASLVACVLPAMRAMNVSPASAMRSE